MGAGWKYKATFFLTSYLQQAAKVSACILHFLIIITKITRFTSNMAQIAREIKKKQNLSQLGLTCATYGYIFTILNYQIPLLLY